jgi:hypothetical protein
LVPLRGFEPRTLHCRRLPADRRTANDHLCQKVLCHPERRFLDPLIAVTERLSDQFPGVEFGAVPGSPPVDPGGTPPGADPIRLGSGNIASFSAVGTSTSGTIYIRGRHDVQYAVCIFGETGKTRMLKLDSRTRKWKPV